jgi:hypothetical protein
MKLTTHLTKIILPIISGLFLLVTVGCMKVIDVDINEQHPLPVLEAYLENDSLCYVKATWTHSFFKADSIKFIENASIELKNHLGVSEILGYEGNGIYRGTTIRGTIGDTYTLSANIDGSTYTAESKMPDLTPIDSISCTKKTYNTYIRGKISRATTIYVHYIDPPVIENYYALRILYLDTLKQNPSFYEKSDKYEDGLAGQISTDQNYGAGDSIIIELASINPSTYLYFKTLKNTLYDSPIAAILKTSPANPTSNFSEGVLGYFAAWSKDRVKYIIPE